jgi:hypothetical protein
MAAKSSATVISCSAKSAGPVFRLLSVGRKGNMTDREAEQSTPVAKTTPEVLFPYVVTCHGCQGYGRDREGSRCQECGGNGVGLQGGLHPRVAEIHEDARPTVITSTHRKVWPHMDASKPFDPMSVHRHGVSADGPMQGQAPAAVKASGITNSDDGRGQ